ncbi:hypothetical protein BC827DRAFT_1155999 [Russula dissimulans]|nr:hypothetical protein BC827DRAFT_1155999 [Russula dissimulans]
MRAIQLTHGPFTSVLHSTFAGPRVTVSPASISNRSQPVTENESMIAERGDEGTTFHEKQRRPPADTEPWSKIMGGDRQPDKLDNVIDVKSTIAFSQMNTGTTLEARDSTTIALFSVPDPNWSRSLISEVATEPTSTMSAARDGAVKMPYLSSTRDDDIRYGTTLTLTPSPSTSNPMTTARAADSSSRPTGESTCTGGASAPAPLYAVPPLHPLLQ